MKKRERLKIKYNLGGGDITFKRLTRKGAEEEDLDRLRGKTLAQISPPLSSLPPVYPRQRMVKGRTDGVIRAPRKREGRSSPPARGQFWRRRRRKRTKMNCLATSPRSGAATDETERLEFRRAKDPLSVNPGRLGRFQLSAPPSLCAILKI